MKTETKVMIWVAVISIIIIIVGSVMYSKSAAPSGNIDPNNSALRGSMDNVRKASDEKVVMVEFGDFECPACKVAYPYVNQLLSQPEYKDTVTFQWRTFPLHGHSVLASRAAFIVKELSNDPNKFFEMGDLLFEKQDEWSTESGVTNQADLFAGYAKSLGVDEVKFKELLAGNKYEDVVEKDRSDAVTIGTAVTPTFYIDGKEVRGADINALKALLDEKIK
jgi:protein-disulfide isomerase